MSKAFKRTVLQGLAQSVKELNEVLKGKRKAM